MKLTSILLILGLLQVSAAGLSQSKINLEVENVPFEAFISLVEQQTDYRFVYLNETVKDRQFSAKARNTSVLKVLDRTFADAGLNYEIIRGKLVVITPVNAAGQQQSIITGNVTDENGNSIPGVNIVVKETSIGTISDVDGNYTIEVDGPDAILVFSFVGYEAQEIPVGNQTTINVTLVEGTIGIEEVVTIGYGTMRRSDIAGASVTINTSEYRDLPSTNIGQSMQGKVAGVSIMNNSGSPGVDAKVRIRGSNSMLGSNNPLIVVDGVSFNSSMNDIHPNDIESLEILKDASATAIYGSRGANGVIVVTTKRGNSDAPKIQLSTSYSLDQVANRYDMLNAADYAILINEMNESAIFSEGEINAFRQNGGTDWQDMIYQNGFTSNSQIGVYGGSNKLKYSLSGSYINQEGVVINTGYKRYTMRANIDTEFSDRLNFSFNVAVSKNDRNNTTDQAGQKYSTIWQSLVWSPTEPVYNDDGTYNRTDQYGSIGFNPFMSATERVAHNVNTAVLANTKINYKLTDKLIFSFILGIEENHMENASFANSIANSMTGSGRSYADNFYWQNSNLLTYKNTFSEIHRLSVMVGFEQSSNTIKGFNASGSNLITESVGYDNLAMNLSQGISSFWRRAALRSYLSRVSYSLKDRYLLTATYRIDGSSKFQDSNKYSSFPSVSLGWRLSEEDFMNNLGNLDNLKLRASWGITGNQAIEPYATLALLSPAVYSYGTSLAYTGYMPSGVENPDLRWEETTQINIGADLSLYNRRLTATVDYFQKETNGLLQATALPAYNGGGTVVQNIGVIENKGIEISLGAVIVKSSDFTWLSDFNFTSIKNKVISIGEEEHIFPGEGYASGFMTSKVFIVKPGEPLGTFYGYNFLGIWQADEAAEAAEFGNQPGDCKYEDFDNNNIIDGGDLQVIGHALPDFTWGLNNSFSYGSFDLNLMIQGVHGRDVLNLTYAAAAVAVGDARSITLDEAKNTWSETNTNTIWPKITSSTNTDHINSTKWLQDGSFIKLRNISLAYTLSKEKAKIGNLRFVLSAQNLFTITKYKGFDPEVSATGHSDIDQGLDIGAYPTTRSYTFGVTLDF